MDIGNVPATIKAVEFLATSAAMLLSGSVERMGQEANNFSALKAGVSSYIRANRLVDKTCAVLGYFFKGYPPLEELFIDILIQSGISRDTRAKFELGSIKFLRIKDTWYYQYNLGSRLLQYAIMGPTLEVARIQKDEVLPAGGDDAAITGGEAQRTFEQHFKDVDRKKGEELSPVSDGDSASELEKILLQ